MPFANLLADFASAFQQDNRILRLRFAANSGIADDALLPESLSGSEQLSQCYRYTLTCLSPDAALELKHFNGQPVEIGIELPDSTERTITGLVTSSQQLASDGGFARYQLTIEPALALLSQRRAARVFQDQSVMQIIGQILDEHRAANPIFQQSFAWQADLSKDYPSRSYCIQYRESDLEFINRLAAEEGISYRFQYTPGDNPLHTVIFFDDPLSLPQNPQSNLRFGHAQPGLIKIPVKTSLKNGTAAANSSPASPRLPATTTNPWSPTKPKPIAASMQVMPAPMPKQAWSPTTRKPNTTGLTAMKCNATPHYAKTPKTPKPNTSAPKARCGTYTWATGSPWTITRYTTKTWRGNGSFWSPDLRCKRQITYSTIGVRR